MCVFTSTLHFFSFAYNSPLSSNATTVPSKTQQQQAQEHASLCEEASRKFPSLIAESLIIAKIIHVNNTVPLFKGFRIWLSELSMLSSSLSLGSIVSNCDAQSLLPLTVKQIYDALQTNDDKANLIVDGVVVNNERITTRLRVYSG
ncbi:Replication protein [Vigna angularis]|uniref:Replication protein n=1 Tax=Phaseolus angularis TaxID=3914 RepID=A0A8T0JHJ2_PHAAN|nr:Replication protein [Vigna angularis]